MSLNVFMFEEHSSVLPHWWRERIRARTVVYLDAHLDLQFVNKDRLSRLARCTDADEFEALGKPHHLVPDGEYGYSIEDFLYPASRLGLIDRLVWVVPPHVGTDYSRLAFDQLCQMDGVQFDDVVGFKRSAGGWIEGRILGLDMILCDDQQLGQMSLPSDSLIDIDIDYFVAVPGDRPWIDPKKVFETLRVLPLTPPFITISRSVESGFTPLRDRFFADYLAALWEGRQHESEHFARLFHLDQRLRAGERDAVLRDCLREQERHPDCAATCYLLSLADPDPEQAASWRALAASLAPAYRSNPLRSVCEIRRRGLTMDLAEVVTLENQLVEGSLDSVQQGLSRVEFGLIYAAFGELARALDGYQRAAEVLGEHPELALELAKLRIQCGQPEFATALLHKALEDDKTRTAALVLLARIQGSLGFWDQARHHLEQASEAAPAWGEPLDLLAVVHEQLGNDEQARSFRERSEQHRLEGERLARRLSQEGPV